MKKNGLIFLIHGFLGSSLNFKPLCDYFDKFGIDTYSFDLAGHGSDSNNFDVKTKKDWINKVKEEFYKIYKDYENITIVGFSMGAILALILYKDILIEIKDKIKICLLSPAFSINQKFFPSKFLLYSYFILNKKIKLKSENPGCNSFDYKLYYKKPGDNISAKRLLDLYHLINIGKKEIQKIESPILIIQSKKDALTNYQNTIKIYEKIKNEKKLFISLEKSNHFIQLDFERQKVFEIIKIYHLNCFEKFVSEIKNNSSLKNYAIY